MMNDECGMMNDEMRSINCVESSISTESMLNCFWQLQTIGGLSPTRHCGLDPQSPEEQEGCQ